MKNQRKEFSDADYRLKGKNGHKKKGNGHTNCLPDRRGNRAVPDRKGDGSVSDRRGNSTVLNRRRKARISDCLVILLILIILSAGLFFAGRHLKGNSVSSSTDTTKISLKNLKSQNAMLVRLDSKGKGKTVAKKNANERIYPASLTKIMTAILAIEKIEDMGQQMEVPYDIFPYLYESNASLAGFQPGELVTAEDLVYGVILESGAECCLALADFIAGSEEAYAELMNLKAEELGMKDSHFRNTTGLHDMKHYTTVRDMSVLLEYAMMNQKFREIITSSYYNVGPTGMHPEGFTMQSTLFEKLGRAEVEGGQIIGGKTGYTEEAGLCLASLAIVDGEEHILVTANAEGSHDTEQYHIHDAVNVYGQLGERE